jgi:acetoin utilization deacetylase AcuC-like enzyme
MPLIVITSGRFGDHAPPAGHPESPARAAVMARVAESWRASGGEVVAPRAATAEQLARVHSGAYIRKVLESAGQSVAFDADTYTSPASVDAALLAAGAAIDMVERISGGADDRVLALVRPPGHHAEADRAMGFCLFNNVAVAAAHARALGASRVAIVDYDVHHGNATQHMFDRDRSVLYVSTHQYPAYPGTGGEDELGLDDGSGFTVNVPLEPRCTDGDYRHAFADVVVPVLREFEPDLLLLSAGFDAHERDPLADMRVTTAGYRAMTAELRLVAEQCCEGRIGVITEGGYDLQALEECLSAVVDVLAASEPEAPQWPASARASLRGERVVAGARARLGRYWRFDRA